jgi:hypothetical protein
MAAQHLEVRERKDPVYKIKRPASIVRKGPGEIDSLEINEIKFQEEKPKGSNISDKSGNQESDD